MKTKYSIIVLILLISGLMSCLMLTKGHNWGGDFSAYIMQSRSIIDGTSKTFLKRNAFTIKNSSYLIGPSAYPWGFPLLLTPVYYFFGLNPFALKLVNVLFYMLFLICLFLLLSSRLSFLELIIFISLFAFNPYLLMSQNNILSDIPFLFFSTLSILLIDKFIVSSNKSFKSISAYFFLGLSTFASFLIRTNGLLLLPTMFVCQTIQVFHIRKENKIGIKKTLALNIIPYIVFMTLFILYIILLPVGEKSYFNELRPITEIFLTNFKYYFILPATFFSGRLLGQIIYVFLIVFFISGLVSNLQKDYHFIIYSFLTIALYLCWPSTQGLRFLFSVLPFYIYFVLKGMKWNNFGLTERYHKLGHFLIYFFLITILAIFLRNSFLWVKTNIHRNRETTGPFDHISMDMFNFIKKQTKSDSIIIFFKPRVMRMITNRNAIMINNCSQIIIGDYLVLHKEVGSHGQVSLEAVSKCNDKFKLLSEYENDRFLEAISK